MVDLVSTKMITTEIVDYLTSLGIPDVYEVRLPDAPHRAIAVVESPGLAPEYIHDEALPVIEKPRLQILSRAEQEKDQLAYDSCWTIYRVICAIGNTRLSSDGVFFMTIDPQQTPFFIERDRMERVIFGFNLQLMLRR